MRNEEKQMKRLGLVEPCAPANKRSDSLVEAIDRLRQAFGQARLPLMSEDEPSRESVPLHPIHSLESVARQSLMYQTAPRVRFEFPKIAKGPFEIVLAFTSDERIILKEDPDFGLYFSTRGFLTDLDHNTIQRAESKLSFPIKVEDLPKLFTFPGPQPEPFDGPAQDPEHTEVSGFSKQAYFFEGGDQLLVTVGPSLPKVARLKNGGAQFWVSSAGVVTQGKGRFASARGISSYNGSAYFEKFPDNPDKLLELLKKGFDAFVSAYFRVVAAEHLRPEPR